MLFLTAGYVIFKIENFRQNVGNDKDDSSVSDRDCLLRQVLCSTDGKKVKQLGSAYQRQTEEDNVKSVLEMERLVFLKFSQNPSVSRLLEMTGSATLEEHTNDPFWGTGCGTCNEDSSNMLGKILMNVREALLS